MFRFRVRVISGLILLGFLAVLGRLGQLQIVRGSYYLERSVLGNATERLLPALRGPILDRDNLDLARDLPSYDLSVIAERLEFKRVDLKEVLEARRKLSAPARDEDRALTPMETKELQQHAELLRLRLQDEAWVKRLAREVARDEESIADGLVQAFDRIIRKWASASAPTVILRGIDSRIWTGLRARQDDIFLNPAPNRRKVLPATASITLPVAQPEPDLALPGLLCTHSVRRAYPQGSSLAHVLGTLGELAPGQWACLREQGVLAEALDARSRCWEAQRRRMSDEKAAPLREVLGVDPRELHDLESLLACLKNIGPERRRQAARLGLADAVRWNERPLRMELCEVERIWMGSDGSATSVQGGRVLPDTRIGETGVESWYNEMLRGKPGLKLGWNSSERSAEGGGAGPGAAPRAGQPLQLTISSAWQRACDQALAAQGMPAAMVVLDCRSGEVLAMASFPNFDPNLFVPPREGRDTQARLQALLNDQAKPLTNRCIGCQYPLGSVMKPFVVAVALEKGLVSLTERFECPGFLQEGHTRYHCDVRTGHGSVNIIEALRRSCNVCLYRLGARVGVEGMAALAHAVGLGRRMELDLPGEAPGVFPDRIWRLSAFPRSSWDQAWSRGKDYHLAIGQGYMSATPLQAACLIAALANGGNAVTPHIWMEASGTTPRPLGLSPATLSIVRQGLDEAVNVGVNGSGTAYRAFHSGEVLAVRVAGKTGTADTAKPNTQPHAWFAGYAPSEAPTVAFAILVEHAGHGGEIAAPIAYRVLKEIYGTRSAPVAKPGAPASREARE